MSRILFLSPADYSITGNKNKTLVINHPGNMLVLYKQNDEISRQFEPVFSKLASIDNRVNFAVLDVSTAGGRDVVGKSRATTTPINGTPSLILYINGRPHTRFNGSRTVDGIRDFITKSFNQMAASQPEPVIRQNQQFMQPAPVPSQQNMYGGAQPGGGGNVHAPIVDQPSLRGKLKNFMPSVEVEEEQRLTIPDDVIPHNMPWEADAMN
jgi:hypothetical protein